MDRLVNGRKRGKTWLLFGGRTCTTSSGGRGGGRRSSTSGPSATPRTPTFSTSTPRVSHDPSSRQAAVVVVAARVYKGAEYTSAYGNRENVSLLVTASKALFLNKGESAAPLGVVGLEMLYDSLARMTMEASGGDCGRDPLQLRCYLLDEHGYVLFSSDLRLGSVRLGSASTSPTAPSYADFHALPASARGPLGKFFGDLDAPERAVMKGLVAQRVYEELHSLFLDTLANRDAAVFQGHLRGLPSHLPR